MSDAFDKKFREKLSDVDIPFDADAWNKMEKKLDALNDDGSSGRTFWWWLAPLLLLLLGTGAFLWWRQSTPSSGSKAPSEETAEQITVPQKEKEVPSRGNNTNGASGTTPGQATIPPQEQTVPSPQQSATAANETAQHKTPATGTATTGAEKARPSLPLVNRQQPSSVPGQTGKQQPADVPPAETETGLTNTDAESNKAMDFLTIISPKEVQASDKLKGSGKVAVKEPVKKADERSKEKQIVPQRKGFSIGVMAGPVFNVAPSLWYGRTGVDVGLLLNYHVNNRWSFTTGAIYSIKPYGGTLDDYGASKKWAPPTNPNYAIRHIDANCKVLDVPININYAFMNRPKYTLSATVGMSSYFMLKENYYYKYQSTWESEKEFTNENKHYMSVLNLGFTYQFPISNHMSLGIQPFAKVPLRGVGFGEVKLYSTGVAVQLNFNQGKRIR